MTTRAAVLGIGSWGTAFAMILADAGCEVTLWGRRRALVDAVNATATNPDYLPGVVLPAGISATHDAARAVAGVDFVVLAVPSQRLRANLVRWSPLIGDRAVLVSLMKGVELDTAKLMSQVIAEVTGCPAQRIAVVSGPNLAGEIVRREPAAAVVACTAHAVAHRLQQACHTGYFRAYTSSDVVGCEVGGAAKNVVGLAVGIADGMGLGESAKASLLIRGLAETTGLGVAMGADPRTFAGLAGMGDLITTCASPLSRNHRLGVGLGRGMTLAEAITATGQTAEGVTSCRSLAQLAHRHHVDMPVTAAIARVVDGRCSPRQAVRELTS